MSKIKSKISSIIYPFIFLIVIFICWQSIIIIFHIPKYFLPAPLDVFIALIIYLKTFVYATLITLSVTFLAIFLSILSGVFIAISVFQFKSLDKAISPFIVILQTTPIVSIIPLLIIWFKSNTFLTLVICAWIACIFPIISSTLSGLKSTDNSLIKIFKIYGASNTFILKKLFIPSALPSFLNGLKISGALALIGGISAEFIAGTGGKASGIAYILLMAGYNLETDKLFAALFIITALGVVIYSLFHFISYLLLRKWHESYAH
ncbi:ABC transporter permease [Fluviispira vulneris]|uniref:ABC transporter permease n=1 Tax=Fluviispira vulneris TaxID=2763012 RepID=UPI0016485DB1|nr:ABC transporter permease [Fluviispira vulneris]